MRNPSACVASALRIKYISNIEKGDMTRSFTDEYLWSQIEPATAILCACLVTYKPLFSNISFSFPTRFSSLFSFKRGSSGASSEDHDDDHERRLQYQWSAAQGLCTPMTYQDMHAKVTKHGVHIIEARHDRPASTTVCNAKSPDMSWSSKTNLKRQQDGLRPGPTRKTFKEPTFVVDFGALDDDQNEGSKGKDTEKGP
ncbi:MAG: hypothetical protein Q9216_006842 [Gyalolechia sp. 2 TL-2023]